MPLEATDPDQILLDIERELREVGVDPTTVERNAMNDEAPVLPEGTPEHVQKLARRAGYLATAAAMIE